jgi:hypothetical protein
MIQDMLDLYVQAGEWADPIAIVSGTLFAAGWVMLFTVRLIKKFIVYSIIALLLPNALGVVGYVENVEDLQEELVERGADLSEEMSEAAEDLAFSPLLLGMIGSALTLMLGIAGIVRSRKPEPHPSPPSSS